MVRTEQGFVLALDGLPSSGKTTVAQLLAQKGWTALAEVATKAAQMGIHIGDKGDLETDVFILCEEIRREKRARALRQEMRKVVLDGSHLSNLAYAKARSLRNQTHAFDIYLNYYRTAIGSDLIVKPDLYAIFELTPAESIVRQKTAKPPRLSTLNASFLEDVKQFTREMHDEFHVNVPRMNIQEKWIPLQVVQEIDSVITSLRDLRLVPRIK